MHKARLFFTKKFASYRLPPLWARVAALHSVAPFSWDAWNLPNSVSLTRQARYRIPGWSRAPGLAFSDSGCYSSTSRRAPTCDSLWSALLDCRRESSSAGRRTSAASLYAPSWRCSCREDRESWVPRNLASRLRLLWGSCMIDRARGVSMSSTSQYLGLQPYLSVSSTHYSAGREWGLPFWRPSSW